MPKLVVFSGEKTGREITLKGPCIIGRDETCNLPLDGMGISREHCKVFNYKGRWVVQDLKSSNGTFVNAKKIVKARVLKDDDEILIGDSSLWFKTDKSQKDSPPPPPSADPLIGKLIGGYKIEKKLGAGSYGDVYRATQLSMDRVVALKILSDKLTKDKTYVRRFLQEASTASQLNHPHIVKIFDAGEDKSVYYFSMEFVSGRNLDDIIKQQKVLPPPFAVSICLQIAEALVHAHENELVHQDIKPGNILLTEDSEAKLADLGLSRVTGTKSEQGDVQGTPHYMSPEQGRGESVDGRSDIYSLGATLYHLLVGQTMYEGKTALSIISQHVSSPVPNPREIKGELGENLAKVVMKMLSKDAKDRYQDAEELVKALSAPQIFATSASMSVASSQRVAQFSERAKEFNVARRKAKIKIHRTKADKSGTQMIIGIIFFIILVGLAIFYFDKYGPRIGH